MQIEPSYFPARSVFDLPLKQAIAASNFRYFPSPANQAPRQLLEHLESPAYPKMINACDFEPTIGHADFGGRREIGYGPTGIHFEWLAAGDNSMHYRVHCGAKIEIALLQIAGYHSRLLPEVLPAFISSSHAANNVKGTSLGFLVDPADVFTNNSH